MVKDRRGRRSKRAKRHVSLPPAQLTITPDQSRAGYVVWTCDSAERFLRDECPGDARANTPLLCAGIPGEPAPMVVGLWGIGKPIPIQAEITDGPFDTTIARVGYIATRDVGKTVRLSHTHRVPYGITTEDIAKVDHKQNTVFWITFDLSKMMPPGDYPGVVSLTNLDTSDTQDVPFVLTVLPLHLEHAKIAFGMFYSSARFPQDCQHWRYEHQCFLDMADHGHTSAFVGACNPDPDWKTLRARMDARKQAGLLYKDVPFVLYGYGPLEGESWKDVGKRIHRARMRYGWPEPVMFGPDEVSEDTEEFIHGDEFREHVDTLATMKKDVWKEYGDRFDKWMVIAGSFDLETSFKADDAGSELWTYTCNRRGDNPTFERFYAGVYTWAYRIKGNYIWAYCDHEQGFSYIVPTPVRPVPTVGWEARREGILDYRILSELESKIGNRSDHAAFEAFQWLQELRERAIWNAKPIRNHKNERWVLSQENPCKTIQPHEYAEIRKQAVEHILAIESNANAVDD